jgi:formate dehydrogenase subunit gamma
MKLRILGLLAALLIGAAAPAMAQTAPRAPSMAEEMEVQALLRGSQIQGRITIPDDKAATLIQPVGREWRDFHNYTLAWVGGITVLGMLAILVAFRLTKDGGFHLHHSGAVWPEPDLRAPYPAADCGA